MNSLQTVRLQVEKIASNRGHLRVYIVASVAWMVIVGFLFWRPLISSYDSLDQYFPNGGGVTEHSSEDIDYSTRFGSCPNSAGWSRKEIDAGAACVDRAKAQAEGEVWATNSVRLLIWLAEILFLPVFFPLMLIAIAVVGQWIKDGYKSHVP